MAPPRTIVIVLQSEKEGAPTLTPYDAIMHANAVIQRTRYLATLFLFVNQLVVTALSLALGGSAANTLLTVLAISGIVTLIWGIGWLAYHKHYLA